MHSLVPRPFPLPLFAVFKYSKGRAGLQYHMSDFSMSTRWTEGGSGTTARMHFARVPNDEWLPICALI